MSLVHGFISFVRRPVQSEAAALPAGDVAPLGSADLELASGPASFQPQRGLDPAAGLRLVAVIALGIAVLSYLPFRSEAEIRAQSAGVASGPTLARGVRYEPLPVAARPAMPQPERLSSAVATDRPTIRPEPQKLCDLMAGDAGRMSWSRSLLFPGEWECMSPIVDEAESPDGGGGRAIFAMARGSDAARVDVIRLKLSLDEAAAAGAQTRMIEVADALLQATGRSLPAPITQSLQTLTPAKSQDDDVAIAFIPEKMFPGRYNLVITFK